MTILIILLAILVCGFFWYYLLPGIKIARYLVKFRKIDGVDNFIIDYGNQVLQLYLSIKGHKINVRTVINEALTFSNAIHSAWRNYDCLRCTIAATIDLFAKNQDIKNFNYTYTTDGGLVYDQR